jgi:signal transduction histidine kinase
VASFEPVDLTAFSLEIASNFTFAMNSAGLKFSVTNQVPADQAIVYVDRTMWEKTILNLMANAIKYTPRGGEIELRFCITAGNFELQIRDTGIGIPPDSLPHLFERFFRVEKHHGNTQG